MSLPAKVCAECAGQVQTHLTAVVIASCADLLAKNWKRYSRAAAKYNRVIPDILPLTYYIPQDYGLWYSEAVRHKGACLPDPPHSKRSLHRAPAPPCSLDVDREASWQGTGAWDLSRGRCYGRKAESVDAGAGT